MNLTGEVTEYLLDIGITEGLCTSVLREETLLRFSNDRMTVAVDLEVADLTIYIREAGARGTVTVDGKSWDETKLAIDFLVEELRRRGDGKNVALPRGPFLYESIPSPATVDAEEMVEMVLTAVDSAHSAGAVRSAGSMRSSIVHTELRSTAGVYAVAALPSVELSIRSFIEEGSSGHGLAVSPFIEEIDPVVTGEKAGHLASMSRAAVEFKGGRQDAILAPMVFANIMSQVGMMASAFYVDMGMSFLRDNLGKKLSSELLTLTDDPLRADSVGRRPFDEEGVPTRRNPIIRDGVLRGFLHNSLTASEHRTSTTANAGLIVPTPFSLVVNNGSGDLYTLADEMGKGLIVTNCWYLRYQNQALGEFSVIPRDAVLLVESGDIVGAVKELRITENMPSLLNRIEAIGDDRQWVRWWEVDVPVFSPSVWIKDLSLTRSHV